MMTLRSGNSALIYRTYSAFSTRRLVTLSLLIVVTMSGCTRGKLEYVTPQGEHKTACETEYTWAPAVDKYAVEYVLAYCAKQAVAKGNTVVDTSLLTLDTRLPDAPDGKKWTYDLAMKLHKQKKLTDKQLGYLIAHLDLAER